LVSAIGNEGQNVKFEAVVIGICINILIIKLEFICAESAA